MKYTFIKSIAVAGTVAAVIVACAEYPDRDGAGPAVTSAELTAVHDEEGANGAVDPQAQAAMYDTQEVDMALKDAEAAIQLANEAGGTWSNTEELLQQARDAAAAGEINTAVEMAIAVEQYSKMARNQGQLEQANFMLGRIKAQNADPSAELLEKIADAENAYLDDNGGRALEIVAGLLAETAGASPADSAQLASRARNREILESKTAEQSSRKMMASSEPVALGEDTRSTQDKYQVLRGDNLWGISAKPTVYSNPYQWPLIYKANLNQIKDPDLITPGQVLAIDRTATPADVERAVHHAKNRGAWTLGGLESSDQAYVAREKDSKVASR